MKVCSYCQITISETDSVCPRDGQPPIEVQPEPIDRELENRFDSIAFFGCGSTGDLYLANDSFSQQHGLLKILRSTSNSHASDRMRIKRELAKQTNFSNHVVPVIAIGETGEERVAEKALWIFRQRIDGESLKICLKREGRLKVSTAIGIAAQIVMGLDMIHRAGLLHRDIKPGHVMLQSHASGLPQVVLLDTGIPSRIETKSLFDLVGTPDYISPEQIAGKLNSFRSDLYALGCVFYEMLVGRPPFIGKDTDAIFKSHQTEPPPVLDVEIPDPLRSLVASLLAKEPRERPFSAQQVFRALEPFLPPSPLFKGSSIASHVQAPRPVVTNQPTKTVSGIVSPASVPPPVPPKSRRSTSSSPPISEIKSSVPPPPPRVKSSVPPRPASPTGSVPPPPPRVKSSVPPRPASPTGSVPPPPPKVKASVPPQVVRTKSSVPPPPVPQGPIAIPRDVPPDDLIPITAGVSSDTAQQIDGETPKEFDRLLDGRSAPQADAAELKRLGDSKATPGKKSVPTGPTHRSNRPSVDFHVESLFDDEIPQIASQPSGTAQDSYRSSEGSVDILGDAELELAADTRRTAPASWLLRYDRRLIIGVVGGLVVSLVLLFAISNWESDSGKTVEVNRVPTPTSLVPTGENERDEAVSTAPPVTAPSESAAKEESSKEARPTEIAKQDDPKKELREDDGESKRSSQSKSRNSSARASSRDTRSDQSDSAEELRTEAREHYAAGRYKSAATAYRKITKIKPSDAGAYAGLGASYLALNRAKRAIKAYKSAIKLQPKNSGFQAALARAYATKGDRDRAIKTYQKALRLNPRNRVAKVALRELTQK